ncbi:hypothetical protein BT69DRAFT_1279767 [Atractiella rhizophila]|nr:hypothetical protein BT69DRAFT_1279767 [Atractiella rhizophila]
MADKLPAKFFEAADSHKKHQRWEELLIMSQSLMDSQPDSIGNLAGRYYRLVAVLSNGSTKAAVEDLVTLEELRQDAVKILKAGASRTDTVFSNDVHYPLFFLVLLSLELKDGNLFAPGVAGMTLQCFTRQHLFVSCIIPTLLDVRIGYSQSESVYSDLLQVEPTQKRHLCNTFPLAAEWIAKIIDEKKVHKKIERAAARARIRIVRVDRVRDIVEEAATENKLFFLLDPSGEVDLPPFSRRTPNDHLRLALDLKDLIVIQPTSTADELEPQPESVYILDQGWLLENNHPAADEGWQPENHDEIPLEALIATEHFHMLDDDVDWDAIDAIGSTLDLLAPIVRHKRQPNTSQGGMSGFSGPRAAQLRGTVGTFSLKTGKRPRENIDQDDLIYQKLSEGEDRERCKLALADANSGTSLSLQTWSLRWI